MTPEKRIKAVRYGIAAWAAASAALAVLAMDESKGMVSVVVSAVVAITGAALSLSILLRPHWASAALALFVLSGAVGILEEKLNSEMPWLVASFGWLFLAVLARVLWPYLTYHERLRSS